MSESLELRGSSEDLLHQVFTDHLSPFLAMLSSEDKHLPSHVVRELTRFAACGDYSEGYAWLTCTCGHHKLIPVSCGGRAFCPSCGGRRMTSLSDHWVERVLPHVPVRQWVFTFPWKYRKLLAYRHEVCLAVLGICLKAVQRWYGARAHGQGVQGKVQTGVVTAVQRAGSALNLNVHFHSLFLCGVYARNTVSGELEFHSVGAPRTEDVEWVAAEVAKRVERWLVRHGYTDEDGEAVDEADPEDAQQLLQAASMASRVALGSRAGRKSKRYRMCGGQPYQLPARCADHEGYNVHAGVVVGAHNREALARLCRYIARPPLAKGRLEERADGMLVLRLKRVWANGTSALLFRPMELLERLAALVPPVGKNGVVYHGILAARAAWRREVIPRAQTQPRHFKKLCKHPSQQSRWVAWARLLWKVFGADGFRCPRCGGQMQLRSVVLRPPATTNVLRGLQLAASRAPPVAACSGG